MPHCADIIYICIISQTVITGCGFIGYYTDDTSKVLCLNPATGNYESFLLSDFNNKYSVKSVKENK